MEIEINDLEQQLMDRWRNFSDYFSRNKGWEAGLNYIKGLLCRAEPQYTTRELTPVNS